MSRRRQPDSSAVANAIRELRSVGFSNRAISDLRAGLDEEKQVRNVMDGWPTVGQDRAQLVKAQDLATRLAQAIQQLSIPGQNALLHGLERTLGERFRDGPRAFSEDTLPSLTKACMVALSELPAQSRPRAPVAIIRQVDAVAPSAMKRSAREGSHFHRACAAAYYLAGAVRGVETPNPTAAIRALRKKKAE